MERFWFGIISVFSLKRAFMSSNDSRFSIDPPSEKPKSTSPLIAKSSNRSLVFLACAMGIAGLAAFAVPKILVQVYLAEEDAKRKQGPIVGTGVSRQPPPGVSTDPYAGASRSAPQQEAPQSAPEQSDADK